MRGKPGVTYIDAGSSARSINAETPGKWLINSAPSFGPRTLTAVASASAAEQLDSLRPASSYVYKSPLSLPSLLASSLQDVQITRLVPDVRKTGRVNRDRHGGGFAKGLNVLEMGKGPKWVPGQFRVKN